MGVGVLKILRSANAYITSQLLAQWYSTPLVLGQAASGFPFHCSILDLTAQYTSHWLTSAPSLLLLLLLLFNTSITCLTVLQAASVLLASGLALSVAVQGAAAAPIRLEDKRREQEELLQQQLSKVEYAIQQQDNVRKAALQGRCVRSGPAAAPISSA
jgi:hypothetical protein